MPWLEPGDESRLDLRVLFEEVVQPVGRRLADLLHLLAQIRLVGLRNLDYFERAVCQVGVERAFTVDFRRAAQGLNVGVFDLPEIVFSLGVNETEDNACVGRAVNVRHTPIVAIDGDRPGYFFESGILRRRFPRKRNLRYERYE